MIDWNNAPPGLLEYLKHAEVYTLPQIKKSIFTLSIDPGEEPDAKICFEIGAAILYDKPLVLLVPKGRRIAANLKRVASVIVEGDARDPKTQRKMQDAIKRVMADDERTRPPAAR